MSRLAVKLLFALITGSLLCGCGSTQVRYVEPAISKPEAAVVMGEGTTSIYSVDQLETGEGERAPSLISFGSPREFKVVPGQHVIIAHLNRSSPNNSSSGFAISISEPHKDCAVYVLHLDLAKGTTYQVSHAGTLSNRLVIANLATGRKWYVDPDVLAYLDEKGTATPMTNYLKP